ncbi:MAG TPA: hypothetical protein PKI20_13885, partial [Verrucomicrobiota bacterium]|nr:hypothetical protein [Verrucomicrobiota bacterium]HQL78766.1 hypothetical protein [Verrucomicrobiota bacterium]
DNCGRFNSIMDASLLYREPNCIDTGEVVGGKKGGPAFTPGRPNPTQLGEADSSRFRLLPEP